MSKPFRWGIVGTGSIVHRWLPDLFTVPGAQLFAICSTAMSKANGIAQRYAPDALCFDRMDEFVRSGINAAYVATNHPYHLDAARRCLEAGIPVLCEKPITPNAKQLRELMKAAEESGVFLMEAMWTRFFPVTLQAEEWLRSGEIGELVQMQGSFTGGPLRHDPQSRLFQRHEGGGALIDIGVYLIHMAALFADSLPKSTRSFATLGPEQVDYTATLLQRFSGGTTASLFFSQTAKDIDDFTLLGTKGKIVISAPFWSPKEAVLTNSRGESRFHDPVDTEGFRYEILHVQDCLEQELTQSPLMPLSRSLGVMELCDSLRKEWGVEYPFD